MLMTCDTCNNSFEKKENSSKNNFCSIRCKDLYKKPNNIILKENHAEIIIDSKAYGQKIILFDLEDLELINKYRWHLRFEESTGIFYARATNNEMKHIFFHRLVTNCAGNMVIYHINRNTLDNRKINLDICTTYKQPKYYSTKKCIICGNDFEPRTSRQLTCSDQCCLIQKRQNKNKFMKKYVKKNKNNPNFLFKRFLNASIRRCIINKTMPSATYITYTKEEFIEHISSKFKEGMNWENYGKWHIDHIKPLFLFEFVDKNGQVNMEALKEANSLDNLQPLWAKENLSKNCRYEVDCEN